MKLHRYIYVVTVFPQKVEYNPSSDLCHINLKLNINEHYIRNLGDQIHLQNDN